MGGALYNWPGEMKVINCTINNNTAGTRAGGVITSGPLEVYNSKIINNNAGKKGGALYIDEETPYIPSTVIMHNNIIGNNIAKEADDIYIELTTSTDTNFDNNYWLTNDPISGTDYNKYNWTQRVNFNGFVKNPNRWIIINKTKIPDPIINSPKNNSNTKPATENRTLSDSLENSFNQTRQSKNNSKKDNEIGTSSLNPIQPTFSKTITEVYKKMLKKK